MKDNLDQQYYESFTKPIIRYGMLTNLGAIPLCFLPAIILWVKYGQFPGIQNILAGWFLIASIFAIYAFVEPISYFPIVGLPGTYMCCLTGNIGNMRVPCAAIAQESVGVTPGTKKAELVSTLGIAGSVITNIIVVTIAALGGAALMKMFPPVVLEGFKYVSPAIFGSMFFMFASKKLKFGAFAIVLALILLLFLKFLPLYVMIPLNIFATVIFGLWDFKKTEGGK